MSFYNGNEYDSEKGSQGNLLKFIWKKIYGKFSDVASMISIALSDYYTKSQIDAKVSTINTSIATEAISRANADNNLQAQILGLKTITEWNPTDTFPTTRSDEQAFQKGNYVRVIATGLAGGVNYKAGDMLIAFVDGATTVAGFADIESNVDIATSTIYGTVKLLANLSAYNGSDLVAGNGSFVITKVVLQSILSEFQGSILALMQSGNQAVIQEVTDAYTLAISNALANYYTKSEIDAFLDNKISKAKGVELAGIVQNEVFAAMKRLEATIRDFFAKKVGTLATITANLSIVVSSDVSVKYIINPIGTHMNGLVLSQSAQDYAGISNSDKQDYDFFTFLDSANSQLIVIFNSDIYTSAEVALMVVGYTQKRQEKLLSNFLASTQNGGVGNDNDTTFDIIPDYILTLQV